MEKPVEYHYANGRHETFDKYVIADDVIRNKRTGIVATQHTTKKGYKRVTLYDNNRMKKKLFVHRIILSTFHDHPPTQKHSVDHGNRVRNDNNPNNLAWKNPTEQNGNRDFPKTNKSAFLVVRYEVEKTVNEWVHHMKDEKNHMGRPYTNSMISKYAQFKQHGFAYKEFPDLDGEEWKQSRGSWEISNMNRVKYKTNNAENVLDVSQLCLQDGYPTIAVGNKSFLVHILCFEAFFPEEYAAMKPDELIRHKHDDPMDFRPENLLIGTQSQNMTDAHDNGKFNGTKAARKPVVSYVDGVREKEHLSISDAVRYLQKNEYEKAIRACISIALENGSETYGRTWKLN
jgi:hypothetical protein